MTPEDSTLITPDDFHIFDWQSIIVAAEVKTCQAYERLFAEEARRLEHADKEKERQVCMLMSMCCSFALSLDTPNEPYKPAWMRPDGKRSYIPSDMKETIRDTLLAVVGEIYDPELRSRIADILWVVKSGNYQIASLAIDAYLESAKILEDPEHWPDSAHRIERALQLATQLGRNGQYFNKVVAYIENLLDKLNGEDPLWFSHRLMSLLLDVRVGDTGKYTAIAEKLATSAEANRDWRRARAYWEIKALWHEYGKETEEVYQAQLSAAETYISDANDLANLNTPNYLSATHELVAAVEALRRIGASRERINQAHAQLLDFQEKSATHHIERHAYTVDITALVMQAVDGVKGKSLRDAILYLAVSCRPTPEQEVRRQVLESREQNTLYWFIAARQINEKGRVIANRPGASSERDPNVDEQAIRAEMFGQALHFQGLNVEAAILPVLNQINLEHQIRLEDLLQFLNNNPFVPPGHEIIFGRGLYYGLTGDFLLAGHLLIPQVESGIRYLLNQNGVITTKLDSQGIQDEKLLNELLYIPELESILGPDLLFDLQGLLINRFGSNLRNYTAHGMLNANAFGSRQMIYFWWLMLYMCCNPALAAIADSDENVQQNEPPANE